MKSALNVLAGFAFASSVLLAACAPSSVSVARARAANDLQCSDDALVVRDLGHQTVEIEGCGRRAMYTCPRDGKFDRACIQEAAAR